MTTRLWPRRIAIAAAVAMIGACGAQPPPTGPSSPLPEFASHTSARFTFRYTSLDAASIGATAATLEREHDRVTQNLDVSQMPLVGVTLHPDRDSLRRAITPSVGTVPAFANGFITSVDQIHILSPNFASAWPYEIGLMNIVHELAHCVSMRVNPAIPNNPRWLWESVALFEAGQIGDARRLPFVAGGRPPTLTELNTIQNTTIYEVGGLIGQFIVETWGRETLLAMVRANGNLLLVPGLTEAEFLSRWIEWLQLGALTNTSRAAL